MNARWYLPGLGRFISADTIVPDPTNPQSWNRYAYTLNNPLRFTDPTGHCVFAFPFDTLGCIIVGLTLAIDHAVNDKSTLQSNPAEIEGLPNVVAVSDEGIPDVSVGLGIGVEMQVNTYYHTESDTFATVGCMCSGLMTPNAGAAASVTLAWTEADTAVGAAEGFYQSVNVGAGPWGLGISTGAFPASESPSQSAHFIFTGSGSDKSNWHPPLMPDPPGTTGVSLSYGYSVAPVGFSSLDCKCTLLNEGTFPNSDTPAYINVYDSLYDNLPQ